MKEKKANNKPLKRRVRTNKQDVVTVNSTTTQTIKGNCIITNFTSRIPMLIANAIKEKRAIVKDNTYKDKKNKQLKYELVNSEFIPINNDNTLKDDKLKDGKLKDGKLKDGKLPNDKVPEDKNIVFIRYS